MLKAVKDISLLFVGYKCKGRVKSNYPTLITATYLSDENQEKFIKWYREEILPKIDEKIDILKGSKNEYC